MCAGQCYGNLQTYEACTATGKNVSCSTGVSHCFVARGDYTALSDQSKGTGAINGCINCAGKSSNDTVLKYDVSISDIALLFFFCKKIVNNTKYKVKYCCCCCCCCCSKFS